MNELVVCMNDSGRHVIDGREYGFTRGGTVYLPSGVPHHVIADGGTASIEFVCFDHDLLSAPALEPLRDSLDTLTRERRFAAFPTEAVRQANLELSAQLQSELEAVLFLGQARASGLVLQLLVNHCRGLLSEESVRSDESADRIAALRARISEDPAEQVTVDDVARDIGMSRTVFTQQFRRHTGMSLIQYVLSVRLNRAMDLLARSDRKITDIAFDCGFNNLGYFHRVFRRYCRMTPRAFRTRVTDRRRIGSGLKELPRGC